MKSVFSGVCSLILYKSALPPWTKRPPFPVRASAGQTVGDRIRVTVKKKFKALAGIILARKNEKGFEPCFCMSPKPPFSVIFKNFYATKPF